MQQEVLARTREKLEQLEARLAKLEALVLPAEPAAETAAAVEAEAEQTRSGPPKTPAVSLARITSRALAGTDARGSHRGSPSGQRPALLTLVGLPDTEVRKAATRARGDTAGRV